MDAIILAGGQGSRLAPWPAPKCLLPVNGVPMLLRLLDHLHVGGYVDHAKVCVGYRGGDVINAYQHSWLESTGFVSFYDGGEFAAMGARLMSATARSGGDRRNLICYGDELADVDIGRLLGVHESHRGCSMTFAATEQRQVGGVVIEQSPDDDDTQGVLIHEGAEVLVNIGFVVAEPECWAHLKIDDGLSDWVNRESHRSRVGLYRHRGKRATVNSLADLKAAEEVWK